MGKILLLSAAYGWFVGLLVVMIAMSVLFVAIALVSIKPIKMDEFTEIQSTKRLLARREAELLSEYQSKSGDKKAADEIMVKLRDVATAEKLVKELTEDGNKEAAFADDDLTEAQAASLENENEKVAIENTFSSEENEGLKKSFKAKLIQSSDDTKVSYFEIKNCILCYEKTKARMLWNNEKFYIGKKNVATLTLRGKILCLYLALNAEDYAKSYRVKTTVSKMYERTPCLFRIRGKKDVKKAKELIALLMSDYGVMYVKTNHSIYALPYEDDDALVAKGLAKHSDK